MLLSVGTGLGAILQVSAMTTKQKEDGVEVLEDAVAQQVRVPQQLPVVSFDYGLM